MGSRDLSSRDATCLSCLMSFSVFVAVAVHQETKSSILEAESLISLLFVTIWTLNL